MVKGEDGVIWVFDGCFLLLEDEKLLVFFFMNFILMFEVIRLVIKIVIDFYNFIFIVFL